MSASQKPATSEAEFDFAPFGFHKLSSGKTVDIVRFLMGVWKPLALGMMGGFVLGVLLYLYRGPLFYASTQVLVSKKAAISRDGGEANRYGDRGDHVQLIQTDLMAERALKDHGLNEIPSIGGAYDPIREILESLTVERVSGQESSFDNVLSIAYLHPDRRIAKAVTQAMVESYRDYLEETRNVNSQNNFKSLIDNQNHLQQEIKNLEQSYQTFRKEAPVFLKASAVISVNGMPAQAPNQYETELASIETAQNENLRKRSSIQARLKTLEKKISDETPHEELEFWVLQAMSTGTSGSGGGTGAASGGAAITTSPDKAALDQQLLNTRMQEQLLLHPLGEQHTEVRNIRKRIETILDFYARQGLTPPERRNSTGGKVTSRSAALGMDLVSAYRDTLNDQLNELEIDNNNLKLLHTDAQAKAKRAELFEVEDQHRKDEISQKKQRLERLYDQIAEYDIARGQEGYRFEQISQVRVERSLKPVIKMVGGCSVMGAVLVFCLSYFREWRDTRIKTMPELLAFSGQSLLGAVPTFQENADLLALAEESGIPASLVYYHRPGSREAEAYRSMRTALFVAMKSGEKTIQLTSGAPGEGKSTTAANLAAAVAQSGKKVLLIDSDLRRPTQDQLFGVQKELGLTDVLLGDIGWQTAIKPTVVNGLSLITSGTCPSNPAELLAISDLNKLFSEISRDFDLVLIDSPPLLAVSDACILATHTDCTLLVVRMNKSTRSAAQRSREILQAHGISVLGAIANDIEIKSASESGYEFENYGAYFEDEHRTTSQKFKDKFNKYRQTIGS